MNFRIQSSKSITWYIFSDVSSNKHHKKYTYFKQLDEKMEKNLISY